MKKKNKYFFDRTNFIFLLETLKVKLLYLRKF